MYQEWNHFKKNLSIHRDRCQILLVISSKFERIDSFLFPLNSSENLWYFDQFGGNRKSKLIRSNLLNIRSEIWQRSLALIIFNEIVVYMPFTCLH